MIFQQHPICGWLFCPWNFHFSWIPYKIHLFAFSWHAGYFLCIFVVVVVVLLVLSCNESLRFFYSGRVPRLSFIPMHSFFFSDSIFRNTTATSPTGSSRDQLTIYTSAFRILKAPDFTKSSNLGFFFTPCLTDRCHLLSCSCFSPLFFVTLE